MIIFLHTCLKLQWLSVAQIATESFAVHKNINLKDVALGSIDLCNVPICKGDE
jgi:hypothetical protein